MPFCRNGDSDLGVSLVLQQVSGLFRQFYRNPLWAGTSCPALGIGWRCFNFNLNQYSLWIRQRSVTVAETKLNFGC